MQPLFGYSPLTVFLLALAFLGTLTALVLGAAFLHVAPVMLFLFIVWLSAAICIALLMIGLVAMLMHAVHLWYVWWTEAPETPTATNTGRKDGWLKRLRMKVKTETKPRVKE